ncbi:MAG: hypothetical protein ACK42Y_11610, partial [Candidatus Thermochlorobacter sp.]
VEQRMLLNELTLERLQKFSPAFEPDVFEYLNPEHSPARKRSEGSTAPKAVKAQLRFWKKLLGKSERQAHNERTGAAKQQKTGR